MRVVALSLCLFLSAVCAPLSAQTAPLEEKQKAVVVFDIQMERIVDSELGKKLELSKKLAGVKAMSGGEGPDPSSITRVFGAMSAPENMAAAMTVGQGPLPMEFFVQMKFSDSSSATDMLAQAKEDNGGTVEHDGSTFYKVPETPGSPVGVMMRQVDDNTVEIGTEAYLFQSDRKPFSANLKSAWSKAPKGAVRIVMDLAGAKTLVAEAIAMGEGSAPPPMGGFIGLLDNMKDLAITLDFAGGNLLALSATGVDGDEAEELKEGLDSLLGMGEMGIKATLPQIREQDPEGAAVMEQLAGAMKAELNDNVVSVAIPTPNGFNDWVTKQVNTFVPMIMGGMGGPPPR